MGKKKEKEKKEEEKKVTDTAILDKLILIGFEQLKKDGVEVSVGELLKALELKDRYRGVEPADISDKVRAIFSGKKLPTGKKLTEKQKEEKLPGIIEDGFKDL